MSESIKGKARRSRSSPSACPLMPKSVIFVMLFFVFVPLQSVALEYRLRVEIDPAQRILRGEARLFNAHPLRRPLNTDGLHNVTLDGTAVDGELPLSPGKDSVVTYELPLTPQQADADNVVLNGVWYPQPAGLSDYRLEVVLPAGFHALGEADEIKRLEQDGQTRFEFVFPYPLDGLTLAASRRYRTQSLDHAGVRVETWFLPANAALAERYLEHSTDYLDLYRELLGPYPYKRFAIVENPLLPTGYSMPSYTLLGSRVLPLPFIVETSLGHEILHQWFGNSVYVDTAHGNWSEGLTRYLADYYYAEQAGTGIEYRKRMLSEYAAYVSEDNALPVRRFHARIDKTHSAVGYGKVAMIFHQLRQRYGDDKFFAALRAFIEDNRFRRASWHDVQRAFESMDGETLYAYFEHWLTRTDVPEIRVAKPGGLEVAQGKVWLEFSLEQGTATPYPLRLPLFLDLAGGGKHTEIIEFDEARRDFRIAVQEPLLRAVIDPEYQTMRALARAERIPDLAWLMGRPKVLAALAEADKELYQPLLDGLGLNQVETVVRHRTTFEQVRNNSVIIGGYANYMADMLFGKQTEPGDGVRLRVYRNPYNEAEVIVLLHARDLRQARTAARKLSHYGKYSELAFEDGRNTFKHSAASDHGIPLLERIPVRAVQPAQSAGLERIAAEMKNRRVLCVGEQHTRFEHHLNQLLLIRKLVEAGHPVVVGMEMFQQPYQAALDDYLAGRSDEAKFLSESHYFEKWRYDYNLYKPILDYAKAQGLPVLALNIEGKVNHKVGREGIAALTLAERKHLPSQLDFSDSRYRSDLNRVFGMHQSMGSGHRDSDYFLQSQVLWDESMAQTAAKFLREHPQHKLVVLAGNGHLRHRYGIPARLRRLTGETPLVVVQDEEFAEDIADYVLVTTPVAGVTTPLLGVFVETDASGHLQVRRVSAGSAAADAKIQKDDVIVKVAGRMVHSLTDLKLALMYTDISKPVSVVVEREGKRLDKPVEFKTKSPHGHMR